MAITVFELGQVYISVWAIYGPYKFSNWARYNAMFTAYANVLSPEKKALQMFVHRAISRCFSVMRLGNHNSAKGP